MTTIPHAITRALERYGLKLHYDDLTTMCAQCQEGYGRLSFLPNGMERHTVSLHGKSIVLIYAPYNGETVFQRQGRIITILPPEAALSGNPRSIATIHKNRKMRQLKLKPKKRRQRQGYEF